MGLDPCSFLEVIELYFETNSYDLSMACIDMGLTKTEFNQVAKQMFGEEVVLFGNISPEFQHSVLTKIHDKMQEYNLFPREVKIFITVNEEYDDPNGKLFDLIEDGAFIVNTQKLLKILFPDENIRMSEVYFSCITFARTCEDTIRDKFDAVFPNDLLKELDLYESAEFKDLIMDIVGKKENFHNGGKNAYFVVLKMGIVNLILSQLEYVVEFDDGGLISEMIDYFTKKRELYTERFFL